MKTNIILIALFVAAFMFPSIGSADTAVAETDISHCANLEATAARPACEAAANIKPAPTTYDDTLMGVQGTSANGRKGTCTGVNCAKRTGCEMGSQGQDEK